MELVERVASLLHDNKMTAKELTECLGLGRTAINDWKRGKSTPAPKSLIGLSHIFNVTTDWLLTGEEPKSKAAPPADVLPEDELIKKLLTFDERLLLNNYRDMPDDRKADLQRRATLMAASKPHKTVSLQVDKPTAQMKTVYMKVFDTPASAGLGYYLDDRNTFEMMEFDEDTVPTHANFGVRIKGDSMEPVIKDGSIVWVVYQPKVDDGDIGIFVLGDEGFCKKLENDYQQNEIRLISLNKMYPPIILPKHEEIRTVGKVLLDKSFF